MGSLPRYGHRARGNRAIRKLKAGKVCSAGKLLQWHSGRIPRNKGCANTLAQRVEQLDCCTICFGPPGYPEPKLAIAAVNKR